MSLLSTPIVGRPAGGAPEVDSSGDEYYSNDDDNRSISSDNDRNDRSGWRPAFREPSSPRRPIASGSRRGTNRQLSAPPPRTTSESLDGLCVICKEKPAYRNGQKAYTTCGLGCAQILKTRCEVCYARPKYSHNGKSFSTCGTTCANKLKAVQTMKTMCIQCKVKPKLVSNGVTYPHCGNRCRNASQTSNPVRLPDNLPSAWETLKVRAQGRAPCLLEVPRGLEQYQQVCDIFFSDWKSRRRAPPAVHGVFKVVQNTAVALRHGEYKGYMRSQEGSFTETRRWVGVKRKCHSAGFADGISKPCKTYGCSLCDVINRNIFSPVDYPRSVPLSGHANRADRLSFEEPQPQQLKAMLLTKVVIGRAPKLTSDEAMDSNGNDVIQLVTFKGGQRIISDQVLVFNSDAISPRYIVLYR